MKKIALFFCLLVFCPGLFAQNTDLVLATAADRRFTARDLPAGARELYLDRERLIAERRALLLDQQIEQILLEKEAARQNLTVGELYQKEITDRVPDPEENQIKAVYEANRPAIGDQTLAEIRPQIIRFLRRGPEQAAHAAYIAKLKTKYGIKTGKNVNADGLAAADILAVVGGRQITVGEFEKQNGARIYDLEAEIFDKIMAGLKEAVYLELAEREAGERKIRVSELIALEITDKLRDFTDAEREGLLDDFSQRLFQKYEARFLLPEPEPFVHRIDTGGEPFRGKFDAPVTIVMFTDFQCPACAAVYPVLKQTADGYGEKVRLVVRDFPLVNLHENAFAAAVAANAAYAQGKFFEYKELLYQNQERLDRESLKQYAARIGLNLERFTLDLEDQKLAAEVRRDMADGKRHGITGTPTVFVNGVKVRSLSATGFKRAIEKALAR